MEKFLSYSSRHSNRLESPRCAQSPGRRDQPLPAAARRQSRGLVSLGRGGADEGAAENKPILLSIGYSACHWCHVMAHESFEDAATAALMNELFVNIKVDREERPDLDKIYQVAQQLITHGSGGWPLTMFLTPRDQQPFFGGTYFPKEPRFGMPAFQRAAAPRGRILSRATAPRSRCRPSSCKRLSARLAPQSRPRRHAGLLAAARGARRARAFVRSRIRRIHGRAEISASRQHRTLSAAMARHIEQPKPRSQIAVYGAPSR